MRNSSPSKLALWMEYSFADLDKTGHMAKLALLSAFEEVVSFDYSRRRAVFNDPAPCQSFDRPVNRVQPAGLPVAFRFASLTTASNVF